jgi:predicted DsbA family dithiol-disulfide isomerase
VPFELHPEIPPAGVPRDLAFPAAYRQQVEAGMQRLAGEVGLTLRTHDRLINSRPALQAAEFARDTGRFRAMHHQLFRAYWDEQRDISDPEVLRDVGRRVGLDVEAMTEAVTADRYGPLLDARRQEAEDLMISGIPAHVVADRYLVMGAQPYDVFQRLMARLDVPKK